MSNTLSALSQETATAPRTEPRTDPPPTTVCGDFDAQPIKIERDDLENALTPTVELLCTHNKLSSLICQHTGHGKARGPAVMTGGLSNSKVHLVPLRKGDKETVAKQTKQV